MHPGSAVHWRQRWHVLQQRRTVLHFLAPASTPPLPLRCRMRVQSLRLDAAPLAAPGILRLRLTDPAEQRWEVPQWLFDSQLLPGGGGRGRRSTQLSSAAASGGSKVTSSTTEAASSARV